MIIGPGDAACETRAHMGTQLFNGQDVIVGRRRQIKRAADHQIGKGRRHAEAVVAAGKYKS